jgi:cytochrome c-type biogenesis protein CcmE
MKAKHQRLVFLVVGLVMLAGAVALILTSFKDSMVYFYAPSDIATKQPAAGEAIRIGGLVKEGSVEKGAEGTITYITTDYANDVIVHYKGELPALFREGQGMVAEGHFTENGEFQADRILAKHDENYMPPEVARSLKKSGHWKDSYGKGAPAGAGVSHEQPSAIPSQPTP